MWARTVLAGATVAAGANNQENLLTEFQTALGSDLVGCTVMRIRGTVRFSTQTLAIDTNMFMGLIVGPETWTSAETAPRTQLHLDWMYWKNFRASTTDIPASQFSIINNYDIDVRSRRRLPEIQYSLFLAVQNIGTASTSYGGAMSVLLALP